MFLKYYGFREQPFGVTPNPRFLYQSVVHREALASLIWAIDNNLGFAALVGEPGMGKTTLLFYLLEKFRNSARTALVFNTQCTSQELVRYLLLELETETPDNDPVILHETFKKVLLRESRAGRRVLVVIDEAQNLKPEVLETVRLLSDFETPENKLLNILLVGQPQLARKLAGPGLSQLMQRIAIVARLKPFDNEDEIKHYIDHRLEVSGYTGPSLFAPEAAELILRQSGGVPRRVNRLCFNALSLGCALNKRVITGDMLREVVTDLDLGSFFDDPLPDDQSDGTLLSEPEPLTDLRDVSPSKPLTETRPPAKEPVPIQDGTRSRIQTAKPITSTTVLGGGAINSPLASLHAPFTTTNGGTTTTSPKVKTSEPPLFLGNNVSALPKSVPEIPPRRMVTSNPVPVLAPEKGPKLVPVPPKQPNERPRLRTEPWPEKSPQKPKLTTQVHTNAEKYSFPRVHKIPLLASVIVPMLFLAGWFFVEREVEKEPVSAKEQVQEQQSRAPESVAGVGRPSVTGKTAENRRRWEGGKQAYKKPSYTARVTVDESKSGPVEVASLPNGHADLTERPLKEVPPVYPEAAKAAGIQGTVVLSARIGKDGRVRDVYGVSGDPLLVEAAKNAVRKWVYRPYYLHGQAMEVDADILVNFELGAR